MPGYVNNPLYTRDSYLIQNTIGAQRATGTPSLQDETDSNGSNRNFEAIISEELLSQEFKGELTNVVTQLSNLQSSLVDEHVVGNTTSLLEIFNKELPDISSIQAFQYIQDPSEHTKAQLNYGLMDIRNSIDTLSTDEKRHALTQLRHLESRIQNQHMRYQLQQYETGSSSNDQQLSLIGAQNLGQSQLQYVLENKINQLYQPLMDIGSSNSSNNNEDNTTNNQGFASLARPLSTTQQLYTNSQSPI